MPVRTFLLALAAALSLAGPALADRPGNVVLFVSDDHGPDAGCYGNPAIRTPHLDALADDGTLFTHAFATTASCSASRSVILTGLHNHANGQYGHEHHFHHFKTYRWVTSLPVMLERAGYRTARAGKYHVTPEEVYRFEQVIPGASRDVVTMTDNARRFLAADPDRPFFLYICTSDPHRGGGVADELPHAPDRFGNRAPGRPPYPGIEPITYDPDEVIVPAFLPDNPATRAELAQYYQSVSRVDQGFGYLIETLRELGVYDDTLIIYISDHGMAMPGAKTTVYEPGLRSPCIVRHPDAGRRGVANDAMISWADLTPTILDFAGAYDPETNSVPEEIATVPPDIHRPGAGEPVPLSFHGRSFLPVLKSGSAEGWDTVHASHTFHEIQMYYPMRVVRDRRWKLIWNIAHPLPFPFASDLWAAATWQHVLEQGQDAPFGPRTVAEYTHRAEFELYDLENDPDESRNLADHPARADKLDEMKARLKRFQQRTQDPWILKWEYE